LKADPKHAPFIRQAGISMVSLANNHAMDYGQGGLSQMAGLLDQNQILHAGAGFDAARALQPAFANLRNGKQVALLSALAFMTAPALRKTTPATVDTAGVAVLNLGGNINEKTRAKLARWIKLARDKADCVVVGIHWGIERKLLPTSYQVALGRALIDAGADIVWGNHPHVLQGAEMYKGHLIMYSMGNLISSLPATTGFFKVLIQADGSQEVRFIPARDSAGRVSLVKPAQRAAAIQSMRTLCRLLLRRYPSTVSVPAL